MQLKKLQEKLGIKLAMKQISVEARTIALEAQLMINFQFKKGDVKLEGETSKTSMERTRGNPAVTFKAMGGMWEGPS